MVAFAETSRPTHRAYAQTCVGSSSCARVKNPSLGVDRNQQYSITALTNASGTITERYAYTAYGEPTFFDGSGTVISASAESNRYTYTGREWDEGLGLYHYRVRMYDAVSGRFCSRDPIGYWDGQNPYENYFQTANADPTGTHYFCARQPTELVDMQPTGGNTRGNVGISITTSEFTLRTCGAFIWTINFGITSPATTPRPSFIMQKLTISTRIMDCTNGSPIFVPEIPTGTRTIWEAWPYDPEPRGLFGNGIDTFSFPGGGPCTIGTATFVGEYGLVLGALRSPPWQSPHPGVIPLTSGPATPTNPGETLTAKPRRHVIKVKWNCCGCHRVWKWFYNEGRHW